MNTNVGNIDRIIRIVTGVFLLGFFFLEGNIKYFGAVGIVLILTSFIRFCPLYTLFGIKTCKR
jgi:hypothetical protein